jgi:hypothetical protein
VTLASWTFRNECSGAGRELLLARTAWKASVICRLLLAGQFWQPISHRVMLGFPEEVLRLTDPRFRSSPTSAEQGTLRGVSSRV